MKILLDENVNRRIKSFLAGYDVYTVKQMKWLGKKNGELLKLSEENNFDLIISNDSNIKFQQNLDKYDIRILVLKTVDNDIESIFPLLPVLILTLEEIKSNTLNEKYIELGS